MILTGVLLSIRPEYVRAILIGRKKFEFRRSLPRRLGGRIYIYATSPIRRIVASFEVEEVVTDNPVALWRITRHLSGLDESRFFDYFKGEETGYALQIGSLVVFDSPVNPENLDGRFVPPQSFCYLDGAREEQLMSLAGIR